MKFSEQWLRTWINPSIDTHTLANQLTMAGLEVDKVVSISAELNGVVIAEVLSVIDHPDAKRLHCCRVNLGNNTETTIVCGADNVRAGLKVAVATVGTILPGNVSINHVEIRGVQSHGMICSAKELGLSDKNETGIMELSHDAPVGQSLINYLELNDHVLDIELTPNRADCLSIRGIAREVAVINKLAFKEKTIPLVTAVLDESMAIHMDAPLKCPRYAGRIIRNINTQAKTPIWLRECLRRSGIRSIHPVVDVMNYVMLELGQPMHAFDLCKLQAPIVTRMAYAQESMKLLDGNEIVLNNDTLVIADANRAQAIAGIIGGAHSSVTEATEHVFLESAYFDPIAISLTARAFALQTDSSYRFARGVDFNLQVEALERATALILAISGGEPGPINEQISDGLPQLAKVTLRRERVYKLLGIHLHDLQIEQILQSLGMQLSRNPLGWEVEIPSYRFDITLEADLIEEIARIYGYQNIPCELMHAPLAVSVQAESQLSVRRISQLLIDRGYHEAITYSFIDPLRHQLLDPLRNAIPLANPLSADMSVMRTSLWPGLLQAVQYNCNRQNNAVRLFEIGLCFWQQDAQLQQINMLGGAITGSVYPLQWGISERNVDFYDVKGDVESILMLTGRERDFIWQASDHPALHPGQQAALLNHGTVVGYLGTVHPQILQQIDLSQQVLLFEFNLDALMLAKLPQFTTISKFPAMRRDIAITIEQNIPTIEIKQLIESICGETLSKVVIFDVYQGDKIGKGQKSIALGLTFQLISRTLTDAEINELIATILQQLDIRFKAKLRV